MIHCLINPTHMKQQDDPQPLSSNQQQSAEEVLRSYGFYLSHSSDDAIDAMEEYATLRCQALESEIGKHMENNAAMSNQVLSLTAMNQQMREALEIFKNKSCGTIYLSAYDANKIIKSLTKTQAK